MSSMSKVTQLSKNQEKSLNLVKKEKLLFKKCVHQVIILADVLRK